MAQRIWNAEVITVDATDNKVTIKQKKIEAGKVTDVLMNFVVTATAQIKDRSGKPLKLSDIQPGNRIIVDYIKGSNGSFTAQSISMSGKVSPKQ